MSQFIEVIESLDTTGDTIVQRVPATGSGDIKMGAQLIVRESQVAIFFRDGRALDTFGPGRHTLSTLNIPILTKLLSLPTGFRSPFRAEVIFVNLKTFANQKWGTREPILFRDEELSMVRLRSFGMFSFRITNAQVFVNTLAGTVGSVSTDAVSDFFRNFIVTHVADFLGEHLRTVLDLARYYNELSAGIKAHLMSDFEKYGVTVGDFKIHSISPPDHVQEMIDKRGGMAAIGSMDNFMRYQAGHALEKAAAGGGIDGEGGSLVGAGIGIGAGLGMGGGMAGVVSQALRGGAVSEPAQSLSCSGCHGSMSADNHFCPQCGTRAPGLIACGSCRSSIPASAHFCPTCGAQQGGESCSNCDADLVPGANFCGECGHNLGD
ncbi:MAG: SPFH domain-containing protein [bacterium]|nr:SPFH domain-containing protein [bacterium]